MWQKNAIPTGKYAPLSSREEIMKLVVVKATMMNLSEWYLFILILQLVLWKHRKLWRDEVLMGTQLWLLFIQNRCLPGTFMIMNYWVIIEWVIDSDNTFTLTPLTLAHLNSPTYSSILPLSYLSFLSILLLSYLSFLSQCNLRTPLRLSLWRRIRG